MAALPSVAEYFANKSVFITGATGFLGKVLVEKLLRSCPDVKVLYLLLRSKKGQSPKGRLQEFINSKAFDRIRESSPDAFNKLRVITGDIQLDELGLVKEDKEELLKECQIVFHVAASVRFDTFIPDAVNLNICGTKRVLQLAENMPNLEVFLHTSTAYCRSDVEVLDEQVYPARHRPQDIIDCMKWMDKELLEHMQPKLIHPEPNTYGYTKSIAEELVMEYNGRFPIVLARPSIVTAALKEPMPGWIDNINGPTGILIGAGKGVIRTMRLKIDARADTVPVDVTVNALILLAYTTGLNRPKDIVVCNITRSQCDPITWRECLQYGRELIAEYPFSVMLWYPDGEPTHSKLQNQVNLFFTQYLPALFLDLLLRLLGKKPFMLQLQKRISFGLQVLDHYTNRQWCFKNDQFVALRKKITEKDDEIFFTDISHMDWPQYLKDYILGARMYCCHEDPSTLPRARRLHAQLKFAHYTLKVLFHVLFCYAVYYIYQRFIINI